MGYSSFLGLGVCAALGLGFSGCFTGFREERKRPLLFMGQLLHAAFSTLSFYCSQSSAPSILSEHRGKSSEMVAGSDRRLQGLGMGLLARGVLEEPESHKFCCCQSQPRAPPVLKRERGVPAWKRSGRVFQEDVESGTGSSRHSWAVPQQPAWLWGLWHRQSCHCLGFACPVLEPALGVTGVTPSPTAGTQGCAQGSALDGK